MNCNDFGGQILIQPVIDLTLWEPQQDLDTALTSQQQCQKIQTLAPYYCELQYKNRINRN